MMASTHYAYAITVASTAAVALDVAVALNPHLNALRPYLTPASIVFMLPILGLYSLAPDADVAQSRISIAHPMMSRAFRMLFHSHRGLSHSLVVALLVGVVLGALSLVPTVIPLPDGASQMVDRYSHGHQITVGEVIAGLVFAASVSMVLETVGLFKGILKIVVVLASLVVPMVMSVYGLVPVHAIGLAAFLGMALHSMGDMHTPSGVAWLAPLTSKKFHLVRLVDHTGDRLETKVWRPIFSALAVVMTAAALTANVWMPYAVHV